MTREEEEIAVAFNDYRDALKLSTLGPKIGITHP